RALADNIRAALRDLPGARVESTHGRVLVRVAPDRAVDAAARLERVFGLVSFSIARQVPAAPDLDALGAAAVEAARAAIARDRPASFKIEARRSDKRFPHPSMVVASEIGARVLAETGLPVDVHTPALRLGVEIGTGVGYVYAETRAAPGGLPV